MKFFIFAAIICLNLHTSFAANINEAPGGPGSVGIWSRPDKQGFLATMKQNLWATIADGTLSETYYPTIDRAQSRNTHLILVVGDALLDERRHFNHKVTRFPQSLAYHVSSINQSQNIRIEKDIVLDPTKTSIVINYQIFLGHGGPTKIYLIHNPAADNTAGGDAVMVMNAPDKPSEIVSFQTDRRGDESPALLKRTIQSLVLNRVAEEAGTGFEGVNSPSLQIAKKTPLKFTTARFGNVEGALGFSTQNTEVKFSVALSFSLEQGQTPPPRQIGLASLKVPLRDLLALQQQEWSAYLQTLNPIGQKLQTHVMMIKGLEDKIHKGAIVAGPAKPWLPHSVEAVETDYESARRRVGDANGGYHRVWPRDAVQMALGLAAAGDFRTAIDVVKYLAKTQRSNGTFWQNTWVDGEPSWVVYQIDQTGFPIVLVGKLVELGVLNYMDFRGMVVRAADALVSSGPRTKQERWEENEGLSPNSIAVACQGLLEAAWLEKDLDPTRSEVYFSTCQKWKDNLFKWTFVYNGPMGNNYFERIHVGHPDDTSHRSQIHLGNDPADGNVFLESELVDGGFLQWIISGLFPAKDSHFTTSLAVYDRVSRSPAAGGLGYLRYNHDGYGMDHRGKAWPLLSGERALAALERGEDPTAHVNVLFASVSPAGVMCEQAGMSVCPLGWAHAEALIVARSLNDRRSFYKPIRKQYFR